MSRHLTPSSISKPAISVPAANPLGLTSTVLSPHQRALFAQRLAVLIQRLRAAANAAMEELPNEH